MINSGFVSLKVFQPSKLQFHVLPHQFFQAIRFSLKTESSCRGFNSNFMLDNCLGIARSMACPFLHHPVADVSMSHPEKRNIFLITYR